MSSELERDAAKRDDTLELALLLNFVIHGLALLGMALLLLPALPGGSTASDAARIALIAEHPWRFRLGWLPWQLCAVADVWLAIAMVRARWLPRLGAWLVLIFTLIAVVPDQYAQALWITEGVELAQVSAAQYLAFEARIFPLTAGWGALFYTLAALAWTHCFARAGTWSRALSWLSVPLWLSMSIAVVSPLLPSSVRPSPRFVSTANGVGFLLLQLWLALVTEQVMLRRRPYARWGRLAPWRHPGSGLLPRFIDIIANGRAARALIGALPSVKMRSDITDVVYVNYLVEAEKLAPLVPEGLVLQRLGADERYALFTFLTYQHHHFGFAFLGKLRRIFPSPVQSNWRIHVQDPQGGRRGVYFVTNAVSHLVPALGARLLTEGMPMHLLAGGRIVKDADGVLSVVLDPGAGTAPDARLQLRPSAAVPELTGAWLDCFGTFRDFLAYCVPQDSALSTQPLRRRTVLQAIELGIPLDACVPLNGDVHSRAAEVFVGDAKPLCFHVAGLSFAFNGESYRDWNA